ncbi:Cygnin [Merops nubicus]|uniref:Cygnin n=1 Tax=Merops nubicus TaxID=57421 RepID=A0A091QBW2_MERNU|nr:Cygnin [Merops nubicus]
MRFLYLVSTVFLLISSAVPGHGQIPKYCPKRGYCSHKCVKEDLQLSSYDCKYFCCIPPAWKGK